MREIIYNPDEGVKEYEIDILGAGKFRISSSAEWQTMGMNGFSFDVSWGIHGFCGGELDKTMLAN